MSAATIHINANGGSISIESSSAASVLASLAQATERFGSVDAALKHCMVEGEVVVTDSPASLVRVLGTYMEGLPVHTKAGMLWVPVEDFEEIQWNRRYRLGERQ